MDYCKYCMSWQEKGKFVLIYLGVFGILALTFYDSVWGMLPGIFVFPFVYKRKKQVLAKERQENLALEFKDLILAFSASLKSGYSVENAFMQAYKDLLSIYEEDADVMCECRNILGQLQNNQPMEKLLSDFGMRSGQAEIHDFAAIFAVAKRSGGNLGRIIRNTAEIIGEKIEIKREVSLMFAAKRMEQNIMNVVPIAIILYMRITSPGYFENLYHTPFGVLVMTVCLVVYGFSLWLSLKIMEIEV